MTTSAPAKINQALRSEFILAVEKSQLSQNQIASRVSVSVSYISTYLGDKFTGNVAALEKKIKKWLFNENSNFDERTTADFHCDLKLTASIYKIISHIQNASLIGEIYGKHGIGKSHAIDLYAEEQANNVFVVQPTEATTTVLLMLRDIADSMKLVYRNHDKAKDVEKSIVAYLKNRNALLVIDDADTLGTKQLNELRQIHDQIMREKKKLGMALIGNEMLHAKIFGGALPALASRTSIQIELVGNELADAFIFAKTKLARDLSEREGQLIDLVNRDAARGGLRMLLIIINRAFIYSQRGEVTEAHFLAAGEVFGFTLPQSGKRTPKNAPDGAQSS